MKSKDILKEGEILKDRRTGKTSENSTRNTTRNNDTSKPTDAASAYKASFGEAKYRTSYGRHRTATVEMLDGSNHIATYNGVTHEWRGDVAQIPAPHRRAVEGYYA
ncbi:hypothetical protein IKG60_01950 [Candidatus Saccharibacteria bacterium]|nr:hypothetical protein [Candidatus Saccharibacteria bacterium]